MIIPQPLLIHCYSHISHWFHKNTGILLYSCGNNLYKVPAHPQQYRILRTQAYNLGSSKTQLSLFCQSSPGCWGGCACCTSQPQPQIEAEPPAHSRRMCCTLGCSPDSPMESSYLGALCFISSPGPQVWTLVVFLSMNLLMQIISRLPLSSAHHEDRTIASA